LSILGLLVQFLRKYKGNFEEIAIKNINAIFAEWVLEVELFITYFIFFVAKIFFCSYNCFMMERNKFLSKLRGFTLVEIMIVVTIIGILASLAVPAFQRARWKALETSIRNNLRQIWGAAQQYMLENGVDQVDFTTIVQYEDKAGTKSGINAGYTSVIKQVSTEDYATLVSYRSTDAFNEGESTAPTATGAVKIMYEDTQGLAVKIKGTGTADRYVKLKL
jgi:type IV pilus assembly protein PilA